MVNGKRIANYNSKSLSPDINRIMMLLIEIGEGGKESWGPFGSIWGMQYGILVWELFET